MKGNGLSNSISAGRSLHISDISPDVLKYSYSLREECFLLLLCYSIISILVILSFSLIPIVMISINIILFLILFRRLLIILPRYTIFVNKKDRVLIRSRDGIIFRKTTYIKIPFSEIQKIEMKDISPSNRWIEYIIYASTKDGKKYILYRTKKSELVHLLKKKIEFYFS